MKQQFLELKTLLAGKWVGEGFAKFPTINSTAYTEQLECIADETKDALFFNQKTWYKNNTPKNGQTVFWDTGFIILKDDRIKLYSVQVGGRMEVYNLDDASEHSFTFNSEIILNDPKSIQSQRIFRFNNQNCHYELNMATHAAIYQNHLKADLKRSDFSGWPNTSTPDQLLR